MTRIHQVCQFKVHLLVLNSISNAKYINIYVDSKNCCIDQMMMKGYILRDFPKGKIEHLQGNGKLPSSTTKLCISIVSPGQHGLSNRTTPFPGQQHKHGWETGL